MKWTRPKYGSDFERIVLNHSTTEYLSLVSRSFVETIGLLAVVALAYGGILTATHHIASQLCGNPSMHRLLQPLIAFQESPLHTPKLGWMAVSIHITLRAALVCLGVGAACRCLYITRHVFRRLHGWSRLVLWGVPLTLLLARYLHIIVPWPRFRAVYAMSLLPGLAVYANCFEITELIVPELGSILSGSAASFQAFATQKGKRRGPQGSGQNEQNGTGSRTCDPPGDANTRYARILGLQGQWGGGELRQQYIELAKQYHPDHVQHLGPKLQALAEIEMKAINEAYTHLKAEFEH